METKEFDVKIHAIKTLFTVAGVILAFLLINLFFQEQVSHITDNIGLSIDTHFYLSKRGTSITGQPTITKGNVINLTDQNISEYSIPFVLTNWGNIPVKITDIALGQSPLLEGQIIDPTLYGNIKFYDEDGNELDPFAVILPQEKITVYVKVKSQFPEVEKPVEIYILLAIYEPLDKFYENRFVSTKVYLNNNEIASVEGLTTQSPQVFIAW